MADRVRVQIGRSINTGNYESVRIDVGLEADVREGSNRQATFEKLYKQAEGQLESVCAPIEKDIESYNERRKKGK